MAYDPTEGASAFKQRLRQIVKSRKPKSPEVGSKPPKGRVDIQAELKRRVKNENQPNKS